MVIIPAHGEEHAPEGAGAAEAVMAISRGKALEVAEQCSAGDVIIAADTVVCLDGDILGKPRDEAEAADMLRRLSGREHEVYTGVTVMRGGDIRCSVERTLVRFRPLTPGEIAEKSRIRPPAWRVQVPEETVAFTDGHLGPYAEDLARDCGDFIVRRADGGFAYQLAVVVDDALMGVTQVVRGADLLSSTPRQLWLYRTLGLKAPEFYHLPLLLAPDGRRLSKRDGDQSLEHLQAKYTPEQIVGRLAYVCGLTDTPAPRTPAELADGFCWDKVPKQDICLPEGLF